MMDLVTAWLSLSKSRDKGKSTGRFRCFCVSACLYGCCNLVRSNSVFFKPGEIRKSKHLTYNRIHQSVPAQHYINATLLAARQSSGCILTNLVTCARSHQFERQSVSKHPASLSASVFCRSFF